MFSRQVPQSWPSNQNQSYKAHILGSCMQTSSFILDFSDQLAVNIKCNKFVNTLVYAKLLVFNSTNVSSSVHVFQRTINKIRIKVQLPRVFFSLFVCLFVFVLCLFVLFLLLNSRPSLQRISMRLALGTRITRFSFISLRPCLYGEKMAWGTEAPSHLPS